MSKYHLIPRISASPYSLPSSPFTGKHLIDGHWQASKNGQLFERLSPSHGIVASIYPKGGEQETAAAIIATRKAFDRGSWSRLPAKARAGVLLKAADLIIANTERMALLETLETGKPIAQSRQEIAGAADLWRYAATLSRTLTGDSHNTLGSDMLGVVLKEPIGVVSIITPWNFPFWILSQKLPFALAAGCTCVVKPSELTPATTVIMGELLIEAGLPDGVVNIVLGYGEPVGMIMSQHRSVDMVSFTGSTAVGKKISQCASDSLKKVALELGGKNPQVIFPDADLASAADAVVFGTYFNSGQCCNSGSLAIVHESIAESFTHRVVELSKQVTFGDPFDTKTQVGAMVTNAHCQNVDAYIKAAIADGARLILGGEKIAIEGLDGDFYAPTIISDVSADMSIANEEVFGPVLSILTFTKLNEAIALANRSAYGLSAGIWSDDIHRCLEFSRSVKAGTIWTNTWMDSFPEMPFGGMKQSGQGREVGLYGLEEFLEVKTLSMRMGHSRSPWVNTTDCSSVENNSN